MIEAQTRAALQERQWVVVDKHVNDVNVVPPEGLLVELWKQSANGVAIALLVYHEGDQFVLYKDVGHAASGNNRTNCGTFPTINAALQQLIAASCSWDDTWET
ncbi:MAG TPA: hypothetical protein V6C63_09370 [Allocoleopsis sp.]